MPVDPILLIGGAGIVGGWTARFLRAAHPSLPLLIGGRDLAKAEAVAAEIGHAEGVRLDLSAGDLGLGDRRVSAVAIFLKDDTIAALRYAQTRSVPHISISSGTFEIGPEVSAYIHKPNAGPVVLGAEWLAGAATLPALEFVKQFGGVGDVTIGALLDEQDIGGPAADIDMHRLTEFAPAALTRRDGAFIWRVGEEATATYRAVDGTNMEAFAYSPYDIPALSAATGSPNVALNVAVGVSSTRRRGEPLSTEIVVDIAGEDHAGRPLRTSHAIVHPEGQAPLTAIGVTMMLERLIGLDGHSPTPAGLYFPEQLVEPARYLDRLRQIGGTVSKQELM